MEELDPVVKLEALLRKLDTEANRFSKPVRHRYPILFALIFTFGVAAVLHGFELWVDQYQYFHDHPLVLLGGGFFLLLVTGKLYQAFRHK